MQRHKDLEQGRQYWNDGRHAEYSAKAPSSFVQRSLDNILRIKPDNIIPRILDAGSGGGRNSVPFIKAGCETYAFDYHQEMVAQTQRLFAEMQQSPLNASQQEMSQLAFSDGAFDIVLSNGVIHNAVSTEHILFTIKELTRVLKPGGHLIFSIFTSEEISSELTPTDDPSVYITADGLKMTLLSQEQIIAAFAQNNMLITDNSIEEKIVQVDTGKRSIFKAIFRKDDPLNQA